MPSDESQHRTRYEMLVVAIILAGLVGYSAISTVAYPEFQEYTERSAEWCEERDGDLVNSNAIVHGGLHCELPNGTSVHMSDVIEVNESDGR